MPYESSAQAKQEVDELMNELIFKKGLPARTMVKLDDVRKLMILCWDRGYTACLESKGEIK